jgi:hypothetical protein
VKATERLYLTVDRSRVVKEGDPDAAFLYRTPGKEISADDMKRYGLTESKAEKNAESKAQNAPPENKAEAAPEDDKAEEASDAESKDTDESPRRGRARS